MNKICIFTRHALYKNRYFGFSHQVKLSSRTGDKNSSSSSSSSSSSDSSDEDDRNIKKKNSEEALKKLNNLLKLMVDEKVADSSESKLELAKPRNKRVKAVSEKKQPEKIESPEKQMMNAVQDVAQQFGGDVKQTESELLSKLLNPVETTTNPTNLTDIVKGMKIDRQSKPEQSRAEQVRQILERVKNSSGDRIKSTIQKPRRSPQLKQTRDIKHEKIDLFNNEPLGIFTSDDNVNNFTEGVMNRTWKRLEQRELKLAMTHPPNNYFQQMILWTEQGKFWKFPIDNEQDLDDVEKNTYFTEHIFLEKYLEPWCPQRGPLRHFMELVCVGLSKNPYLTADEKKAHIEWFKEYFDEKRQLLQDVGALQSQQHQENEPKKIS